MSAPPRLAAGEAPRAPVAGPLNLARACLDPWADDPAHAGRPAFTFLRSAGGEDDPAEAWSYAEARERVLRIARGLLARGLEPGDRVLVRLPHSPAYALAFFGANAAGLTPIPASPQLTDGEAAFLAADAAPRAAFVADGAAPPPGFGGLALREADLAALDGGGPLPETAAEDPAFLIYTSGTGARPKGVLHAQRTLLGRAPMWEAWEGYGPDDAVLHAGALNWSYTLGAGLIDVWATGGHALLYGGPPDPAVWAPLIARRRATVFAAVPTVHRQLLKYGEPEAHDLSSLRHGLCAGEPLPPSLRREWLARAGTELYEALGMTEVSTYVSSGPATPVREGSPGRPQPGRRVAVLPERGGPDGGARPLPPGETGLLAVHRSDPGLMLGYWRRPEEQAAAFRGEWFVGGDLASIGEDGYVRFRGRADDAIKSFGHRLSPVEIEAALETAPSVAEVAVVGLPIDEAKTLVAACVAPEDGAALDEEALRAHAASRLAAYKRPHRYVAAGPLPRTRNGKLLRRELAARLLAAEREGG